MVRTNSFIGRAGRSLALVVPCVLVALGVGGGLFQAKASPTPGRSASRILPHHPGESPCYFPLEVGNRWGYAMTQGPVDPVLDSRLTVLTTVEIPTSYWDGGQPFYQMDNFMFPFVEGPSYFFNDSTGQATELMDGDTGVWYPWSSFGNGQRVLITLPSFAEDCIHGSRGRFVGLRKVTVPAGTFEYAAVVAYDSFSCADEGLYEEVFAPGVGLIRRTLVSRLGLMTWSLSYAIVSGQVWGTPVVSNPLGANKTSDSHPGSPVISVSTWGALKSRFQK